MSGGASSVSLEAGTIRELFRKFEERYPLMLPLIEQGVAVSIDGVIYRDSWEKSLPDGAQIYLLPPYRRWVILKWMYSIRRY